MWAAHDAWCSATRRVFLVESMSWFSTGITTGQVSGMNDGVSLQALDQVPIQGKRYVRASDIPQPFRDEFLADSRGSTQSIPDGEAGACVFVWDWQKWLSNRRSPDDAPRFAPSPTEGSQDE